MSRFTVRAASVFALVALVVVATPGAQSNATPGYLMPPKVIADIMDAEPLPGVSVSPDRTTLLLTHRRSMPTRCDTPGRHDHSEDFHSRFGGHDPRTCCGNRGEGPGRGCYSKPARTRRAADSTAS